jgi:hypothetical protein
MSLTTLRQAALASRRYPVGGMVEVKRPGSEVAKDASSEKPYEDAEPEPHWQASIESATD